MSLLTIDIGGTSIKYARFADGKLGEEGAFGTPDNLDQFYQSLAAVVEQFKENSDVCGVAISSPGAVNKATGVIEGASALPYIHDFDIHAELEKRFGLPVSIENDANCAALAEVKFGAAKGLSDVLLLVLGTGVGGSVVMNGKVHHGKHLFGGEFGFMLMDDEHSFSTLGTTIRMAERYNKRTGETLDAIEIFEKAFNGDEIANEEKEIFYHGLLLGLLRSDPNWLVQSNAESGDGFADILAEPEDPDARIVIELKYSQTFSGLQNACERALAQIREKRYDERLRNEGRNNILAYGVAFCKKRCKVAVQRL